MESTTGFYARITGGYADDHELRDLMRNDSGYSIVPIELRIISLHDWSVKRIRVDNQNRYTSYEFQLPLRDFPKSNLPWSDWIQPVAVPAQDLPQSSDVSIRYRWMLTPTSQNRVYRPLTIDSGPISRPMR